MHVFTIVFASRALDKPLRFVFGWPPGFAMCTSTFQCCDWMHGMLLCWLLLSATCFKQGSITCHAANAGGGPGGFPVCSASDLIQSLFGWALLQNAGCCCSPHVSVKASMLNNSTCCVCGLCKLHRLCACTIVQSCDQGATVMGSVHLHCLLAYCLFAHHMQQTHCSLGFAHVLGRACTTPHRASASAPLFKHGGGL